MIQAFGGNLHEVGDTFELCKEGAIKHAKDAGHVLVEPSGATTLTGAWLHRADLAGQRVVLAGGNTSAALRECALAEPWLW